MCLGLTHYLVFPFSSNRDISLMHPQAKKSLAGSLERSQNIHVHGQGAVCRQMSLIWSSVMSQMYIS